MTETLVAPENEMYPNRTRITRTMCQFLVENGLLTGRYELIDGVIISKMGQNAPHASTIMLLLQWLSAVFGVGSVRIQLPLLIPGEEGETTEPEPDVAVTIEPASAYFQHNPGPSDVSFVAEVSDSTLRFDLTTKALLYARVGIPEYWALDIVGRQLHRHRQPTHDGYGEIVVFGETESIAPPARPEVARIGDLFPPLTNAQP